MKMEGNPEEELNKQEETELETPTRPESEENAKVNEEVAESKIDEISKLQDELAEAKDKYIRLFAEFDNHRRRTAKEKLELIQNANEQLIKSLLPVVDDFDRAESSFQGGDEKAKEGFTLIHNKLKKVLEEYNVKPMDVEKSSSFDPDFHEAVTQVPAPSEDLKGKVIDVVEKGYLLNEKVIRYAKVVVGS